MEKLGYEITLLEEKTFKEIMSQVVFDRDEAQRLIDNTRDIPNAFPMVIYGMYPEE